MTKPIALTGKFRSGKDSVASYLIEHYGYTRFAFADELKRYAHELFGQSDVKQRELFQWFGQTMRERDPNIWVRKCFDAISIRHFDCIDYEEDPDDFCAVITDLRQPNEFDRCRAEGYVIIRVNCDDDIRIQRARESGDVFDESTINHETETHVDEFDVDFEINNSGKLTDTYRQIDVLMEELGVERIRGEVVR